MNKFLSSIDYIYIYIHHKAELQLLGIFNLHCTLAIDLFVSIGWDIYIYMCVYLDI